MTDEPDEPDVGPVGSLRVVRVAPGERPAGGGVWPVDSVRSGSGGSPPGGGGSRSGGGWEDMSVSQGEPGVESPPTDRGAARPRHPLCSAPARARVKGYPARPG